MRRTLPYIIAAIVVIVIAVAAFAFSGSDSKDSTAAAAETTSADASAITETGDRVPHLQGVGVVDVVALMRNSKAAQSIEDQLAAKRKSFQEDLSKQEKKLRSMEEDLIKQRDKKDEEAFNKKRKEFETAVRELQKSAQQKRMTLDKSASNAVGRLQEEITKITAETANAKNLQIVLTRDQVVVVSKPLDITTEIMTKLDQALPRVEVKTATASAPAEEAAPAADKE